MRIGIIGAAEAGTATLAAHLQQLLLERWDKQREPVEVVLVGPEQLRRIDAEFHVLAEVPRYECDVCRSADLIADVVQRQHQFTAADFGIAPVKVTAGLGVEPRIFQAVEECPQDVSMLKGLRHVHVVDSSTDFPRVQGLRRTHYNTIANRQVPAYGLAHDHPQLKPGMQVFKLDDTGQLWMGPEDGPCYEVVALNLKNARRKASKLAWEAKQKQLKTN